MTLRSRSRSEYVWLLVVVLAAIVGGGLVGWALLKSDDMPSVRNQNVVEPAKANALALATKYALEAADRAVAEATEVREPSLCIKIPEPVSRYHLRRYAASHLQFCPRNINCLTLTVKGPSKYFPMSATSTFSLPIGWQKIVFIDIWTTDSARRWFKALVAACLKLGNHRR